MTLLVIRHASSSAPRQLPTRWRPSRAVQRLRQPSEVRQCSVPPQARSADWVLLDVGNADEAQWQAEGGALQAALERLCSTRTAGPSEPGLDARLRLQHGPAAVVVDQRSQQAGYPLSLAIVGRRLAQEG